MVLNVVEIIANFLEKNGVGGYNPNGASDYIVANRLFNKTKTQIVLSYSAKSKYVGAPESEEGELTVHSFNGHYGNVVYQLNEVAKKLDNSEFIHGTNTFQVILKQSIEDVFYPIDTNMYCVRSIYKVKIN